MSELQALSKIYKVADHEPLLTGTQPALVNDLQTAAIEPMGTNLGKYGGKYEEKGAGDADDLVTVQAAAGLHMIDADEPTSDELMTLRKVPATMPWAAMFMCLIELAERASYYGSKGPFNNFINNPLPKGGNGAGAVAKGSAGINQSAGALGLGSVAASALTNLFTFLAYVIPIYGGIVADTKWGRFKTIWIGTLVGAVAHVLLVIPAIPSIISHPNGSLGAFIISLIILAFAAGFIKPSLGPLLCDQNPYKKPTIKVLKSGERVVIDPNTTIERWLLIFYACINIGAFFALATSYAQRFVGFWLAYLLPAIIYMIMPVVLVICGPKLRKAPPQGSVVAEAMKVMGVALSKGGWKKMFKGGDDFWNKAKPSYIAARDGQVDLEKVFWDDRFVDEIRQSVSATAVFMLIPIFVLADGGLGNQLNDMSVAMTLNGLPNDLINNWNPLSIIVFTPIITFGLYPMMTRLGYPLKPMMRMCIGFLLGAVGCIIAAVVQWRIYKTSPCGYYATTCEEVSPVSLWWQVPIITIPAIGELFVNVTSYEIAYTRAPARMKGLVYALALFNSAIGAAISLALSNVIQDPWLIWPWVALAAASVLCAILFPTYYKHLDDPVTDFGDPDRQAGAQQPKAILERQQREHTNMEDVETKY
ncbi:uncharacterized protein I206_106293 [Kwoniella pini CBS 10737]|uniref:POT family proton-dependent oligopeptide transporter n=1 Tax=Kwoniella pini CBS 10737 TaxID=1296096 RepID=A0A1B9I1M8_9TREE|nr:POT family proton-dependent oligopeptide transporter [Kwoniella pini CBS 10737]OCF49427.1 POT family proton-dependent oligopeptide transporter [Kwoniella pini CBS 10737]